MICGYIEQALGLFFKESNIRMMVRAVLQQQQRELLQQERRIADELQTCLVGFEGADAFATTLRQVTTALDEIFLLVIVGEFNAGKSAASMPYSMPMFWKKALFLQRRK